ncbi:peptidoglycan-binding protein [Nonomuraea sp. NPDC047897]|uniref:peptidoglycan-binding protein n=1 Tax=Nonomuraea sp. NPDC047897 TaxID=3364346 RepID=UPI0037140298
MRSPRKVLLVMLAGVLLIAGAGWAVSTRLRSPADEAALRRPPKPSLVTAPVERVKLTSTVVVSGTLEYGSPLAVTLAGVVGGQDTLQRATRAPRPGRLAEGGLLMEVNGRPVFVLTGKVPMHRTIVPGAEGADVRQLQRALRRLGHRPPVTGVFDRATVAAVTRFYARKGYTAQQPTLEARQQRETLRKAVRTARETLAAERQALDAGRDVLPLKIKVSNAKADLKAAERALDRAGRRLTPEEEARRDAAEAAVRAAEEKLLEAEQALAEATRPTTAPTAPTTAPTTVPTSTAPGPGPAPTPPADTRLLELRVANAQAELDAARAALDRLDREAGEARTGRLEELRKTVRDRKEALRTAEQALRQARQLSPARLKVAGAKADLAAAGALLAEFERTYGTTIPPGEIVFLPKLPARLHETRVKAGETVEQAVATVTSSSFVVAGAVEAADADLLKEGMQAVIETETGRTYPATLTAIGQRAAGLTAGRKGGDDQAAGSEPVLITPSSTAGLKRWSGKTVTARVTVGATGAQVLAVPSAAVVTAADGRPRVQVEVAPDRVKEVEVRTGLTADGKVEVTGDLRAGDRVVVGGA